MSRVLHWPRRAKPATGEGRASQLTRRFVRQGIEPLEIDLQDGQAEQELGLHGAQNKQIKNNKNSVRRITPSPALRGFLFSALSPFLLRRKCAIRTVRQVEAEVR
jgi:hypothetical protein